MSRVGRCAAVVALVALAVVGASPAAGPRSFSYGGECVELATSFPVQAAAVRALLPPGFDDHFTLVEADGTTIMFLAVVSCQDVSFGDGGGAFSYRTEQVIVPVAPPAGCEMTANGCATAHAFMLWGPVTHPALHAAYAQAGLGERTLAPAGKLTVDASVGALATAASARIRWSFSPHTVAVSGVGPFVGPAFRTTTLWQLGSHGPVANSFAVEDTVQGGQVTIDAAPGSPLASLIGTHAEGGAVVALVDFVDTVQVVE